MHDRRVKTSHAGKNPLSRSLDRYSDGKSRSHWSAANEGLSFWSRRLCWILRHCWRQWSCELDKKSERLSTLISLKHTTQWQSNIKDLRLWWGLRDVEEWCARLYSQNEWADQGAQTDERGSWVSMWRYTCWTCQWACLALDNKNNKERIEYQSSLSNMT